MKRSQSHSVDGIRHRLLEGVLLRLARLPARDQFILRGGMLMRLWFRPHLRVASDLDLVATFPFSVDETASRLLPLLGDHGVDDGVLLDRDRYRIEGIWLNTNFPGVRVFACGEGDGARLDFSMDITFGEPLVPEPTLGEYVTQMCGLTTRLWMCRPETILGRKMHALVHMGMRHWRAKDLNDLRLLCRCVALDDALLPEAISASFTSRGDAPARAKRVFSDEAWWGMKTASARWQDFVRRSSDRVPGDLTGVVAEVGGRLQPILEQLP